MNIDLSKCRKIATYVAVEQAPDKSCKSCKGKGYTGTTLKLKCVCTVAEFVEQ